MNITNDKILKLGKALKLNITIRESDGHPFWEHPDCEGEIIHDFFTESDIKLLLFDWLEDNRFNIRINEASSEVVKVSYVNNYLNIDEVYSHNSLLEALVDLIIKEHKELE